MTDLNEFQRFKQRPFVRKTRFFPDEGPLLETLGSFEISHVSYQTFNFLPYLSFLLFSKQRFICSGFMAALLQKHCLKLLRKGLTTLKTSCYPLSKSLQLLVNFKKSTESVPRFVGLWVKYALTLSQCFSLATLGVEARWAAKFRPTTCQQSLTVLYTTILLLRSFKCSRGSCCSGKVELKKYCRSFQGGK